MKTIPLQKRKATFVIDERVLRELKEAVQITGVKSVNALVNKAIQRFLDEIRGMKRRRILKQAANDPLFLADVREVGKDFGAADSDFLMRE